MSLEKRINSKKQESPCKCGKSQQKNELIRSPGKKIKNPAKELYQDFTVTMGIKREEDTDLNMSPEAKYSTHHNFI